MFFVVRVGFLLSQSAQPGADTRRGDIFSCGWAVFTLMIMPSLVVRNDLYTPEQGKRLFAIADSAVGWRDRRSAHREHLITAVASASMLLSLARITDRNRAHESHSRA
jgi:hypothetical protein